MNQYFGKKVITSTARGDDEDDTVIAVAGGKSLWTARVSSRVRPGAPLQLAVDRPILGGLIREYERAA